MLSYEFIDPGEEIGTEDFRFVENFLKSTARTQIGWHYITDITWIYSRVKDWSRNLKIVDAGGARRPLQFLLAELGFNVVNIDMTLTEVPKAYRRRYGTRLQRLGSCKPTGYEAYIHAASQGRFLYRLKTAIARAPLYQRWKAWKYEQAHDRWRMRAGILDRQVGTIKWVRGNLCGLPEIASDTFDAVVSLSALEHIPLGDLDAAVQEIHRILKPNARWAVTTSGTEQPQTWFHHPSQACCFSVADLERIFEAQAGRAQDPDEMLEKYRQCAYLRYRLADFYKRSGQFGMPWGIWDPKYIPVGLTQGN